MSMKITIEIDTADDAFNDAFSAEMQWVLSQVQRDTERWHVYATGDVEAVLFDSNGNRCGFVRGEFE